MVTTDTLPPPQLVKDNVEEVVNNVKASGIKPYIVYTQVKSVDISITINIEEPDTAQPDILQEQETVTAEDLIEKLNKL